MQNMTTKNTKKIQQSHSSKMVPLDKARQKVLQRWLKQTALFAKPLIRLNALIGWLMSLAIIAQAGLLAWLLHEIIIQKTHPNQLLTTIGMLFGVFLLRAILLIVKEKIGQKIGQQIRQRVRQTLFEELSQKGPSAFQVRSAGAWSSIIIEQVDNLNDYYAKYLPQMQLAVSAPLSILVAVFWFNWAAGLILLLTAPLIPIFMALVGLGAADANRRNFRALALLSGYFLDRLKGLDTLRIFHRKEPELKKIAETSHYFRIRTMEVLRLAFLSSGVLEFFTSVSIALMAVYFGFSFLGDLNFGHYGMSITLFIGFFCLMLAPEFYQPLRELGTYYHAKAQAIAAADTLITCLSVDESENNKAGKNTNSIKGNFDAIMHEVDFTNWQSLSAKSLRVKSFDGVYLTEALNFQINRGDKIALMGESGSGKSSLMQCLLGFLPYEGEIIIDGISIQYEHAVQWRKQIHWLGQNPILPGETIAENIALTSEQPLDEKNMWDALAKAKADEFVSILPEQHNTLIGDNAVRLSVGQAQRIALAKLFYTYRTVWFLDEPTASLDKENAEAIMTSVHNHTALNTNEKAALDVTLFLITHDAEDAKKMDIIWTMHEGKLLSYS
ncbi:heme ABC transporter permease/ATP-binding protein CydD [Thorsellia anophelis]|uniref:ATP-binding cassette, subfamily C, CydD n=1 Tax=Thorsellia anophelis DSM 18579 TaxID=1123402 RepID=A0A1H9ZWL3_9GAMM|nr:cysteine/glutathione ABC transporter permease/ATP-binding protein CydD [Thorsellia anophelis]SES86164.1 ATP-binding cassette, subfamily C, CydD [Thorsellia anophelis DSM 18579]